MFALRTERLVWEKIRGVEGGRSKVTYLALRNLICARSLGIAVGLLGRLCCCINMKLTVLGQHV